MRRVEKEQKTAEVVEASSSMFKAQCYELYGAPPLGALVRVGDPSTYAVVTNIVTQGLDPSRRVVARGRYENDEEAVYSNHPQLSRLLSTSLEALILGYAEDDIALHYLPPAPPRIHAFVYRCTSQEVAWFTRNVDFLNLLVDPTSSVGDEVIAACLREAAVCHGHYGEAFLMRAGRALAVGLGSQLNRLETLLIKIAPKNLSGDD